MEPLAIGAERGLPIVDADGVGRAFPELQMLLPFVYGSPPYPAAIGDEKGNVVAVTFANSPKSLEDFFREKTIEMGLSIYQFMLTFCHETIMRQRSRETPSLVLRGPQTFIQCCQ